jgi:hypothetical protein
MIGERLQRAIDERLSFTERFNHIVRKFCSLV